LLPLIPRTRKSNYKKNARLAIERLSNKEAKMELADILLFEENSTRH
jgi:hypothetical protein